MRSPGRDLRKSQGRRRRDARGPLPCVWAVAGRIAARDCDADFECENCPLDAELATSQKRWAAEEDLAAIRTSRMEFPDDRRYHPSHLWVESTGKGRVRIGLDAFAAGLLRRATGVILPTPGSPLIRGHVGCWLMESAEPVSLKSPVTGEVTRVNPHLRDRPALAVESSYGSGWLMEVEVQDPDAGEELLLDADAMRQRSAGDLRALRRASCRYLASDSGAVGPTLHDGGLRIGELREMLGPRRYHGVVAPFL
jgi:glycine cleavage system H protein